MKLRIVALLLLLPLLLAGCVTTPEEPEQDEAFRFYYPAQTPADGSVFLTQPVDETTAALPLAELMAAYLAAQPPVGAAPLPEAWRLQSAQRDASVCSLVFSGGSISPLARTLVCSSIAQTLLQLSDVQRVSIQTPGSAAPLVLSAGDILLTDTGMLPQDEQMTLYYPDSESRYLLRLTRTVQAATPVEKAGAILSALLSDGLLPAVPPQTTVLGISIAGGICTVDLSAAFTEPDYRFAEERTTLYAIVNSLTELPQIRSVEFLVAGEPLERLGRLELSSGLTRDESLLFDASDADLIDRTLYAVSGEDALLVDIPMQLEPSDTPPEQVLSALIAYEGAAGIRNPIPTGTRILSVRIDNATCTVDLTGEFIDGCASRAEEESAVRAVVATLCALDGIDTVEILVEGIEPTYRTQYLLRVRQPSGDWFAK